MEWTEISQYQTTLYADDTSILVRAKTDFETEVASILRTSEAWFNVHNMALHINITKVVNFSSFKRDPCTIAYNNTTRHV